MLEWIKKIYIKRRNGERLVNEVKGVLENLLSDFGYSRRDLILGVKEHLQDKYKRKDSVESISKMKMDLIQRINDVIDATRISFSPEYEKYKTRAIDIATYIKLEIIRVFEETNENTCQNIENGSFKTQIDLFRNMIDKRFGI